MPWKANGKGLAQCEHEVQGKTDGRVIIIQPDGSKIAIYRTKNGLRQGKNLTIWASGAKRVSIFDENSLLE